MGPVMKSISKTPDRSVVDVVASLVASYSIGLFITNGIYI